MSDDRSTSDCSSKAEKPTTECGEEIPTAAIVSFAGEETHEFEAYGSDETDLTYRDNVEKGDELVRRSDHEQDKQEAVERERQRIQNLIEKMKQEVKGTRLHSADVIEAFNELLDEVEQ